MARGRKGNRGRALKGGNNGRGNGLSNYFVTQKHYESTGKGDSEPSRVRPFSLQDEARNTGSGHLWPSNRTLRYSQVKFVSAESSMPDQPTLPQEVTPSTSDRDASRLLPPRTPLADMSIEDKKVSDTSQDSSAKRRPGPRHQFKIPVARHERGLDEPLFFVDTNGSRRPLATGAGLPNMPRSPSPLSSDPCEEVIVFEGRRKTQQKTSDEVANVMKGLICSNSCPLVTDHRQNSSTGTGAKEDIWLARLHEPLPIRQPAGLDDYKSKEMRAQQHLSRIRWKRQRKQATSNRELQRQDEEDEVFADYIANMVDEERLYSPSRDVTRDENLAEDYSLAPELLPDSDEDAAQDTINALLNDDQDWDSSDMRDFDDLSTSSAEDFNVNKILSKRQRPSGGQYLAIGRDQSTGDARWLPASSLVSTDALKCIRDFDLRKLAIDTGAMSSQDTMDSNDDTRLVADLQEDFESCEDELDLRERRRAKMTDEKIARLLSKQEELGLGSSELLLFDGGNFEACDDEAQVPNVQGTALFPGASATGTRQKTSKNQGEYQLKHGLPSAMMFADILSQDPYSGFDVMDHERPSLQKTSKGRRSAPIFELSDVELEASLQVAWDKDRSKKKLRKKEREELRAQGHLGRQSQTDIRPKYVEGLSFEELKVELMDFVVSSRQR
ncbi:MAG: hypothetical protein LQ352_000005 [Teloschistes flavicans]|nr:MAG: hypothetical protein LQ352_000005 [Teloschistes flavicans]